MFNVDPDKGARGASGNAAGEGATRSDNLCRWGRLVEVPVDEIFGVAAAFKSDRRPVVASLGVAPGEGKMDLSIGAMVGENGRLHVSPEIAAAATRRHRWEGVEAPYLPQEGYAPFTECVTRLIHGVDAAVSRESRVVTIQTTGGSGALTIGGLLYKASLKGATPQVLRPTLAWPNYPRIFSHLGFEQGTFADYDATTRNFDGAPLLEAIGQLRAPTLIVLQPSCSNPTGNTPTLAWWRLVSSALVAKIASGVDVTVFFDSAYQGLGRGLTEDVEPIRLFVDAGIPTLTAWSGSKNFGLYNHRVGALSVTTDTQFEARLVRNNLCSIIRAEHSNCPALGAQLVADVLTDSQLKSNWELDLARLRLMITRNRNLVADAIKREDPDFDDRFIREGQGLFSHLGLTPRQADGMRADGIYMPMEGRIAYPLFDQSKAAYFARCFVARVREERGSR